MDQTAALDEFQTRHSTINERINETYKTGNQLLDYLEKQIILDFHFRGEQDVFEAEYPHLKEKAIKYLGHVLYYDLSPYCGNPVPKDSEMYQKLWTQYELLEKIIQSELDKKFKLVAPPVPAEH